MGTSCPGNMKKIIKVLLVIAVLFVGPPVLADTTIHLNIKTDTSSIYDQDITVTPCDSDNAGTLKITAYCSILQSGVPSTWDWQWAPGAFVTSVNNIAGYTTKDENGNDVYHYWSWSLNGTDGTMGLNQYELQPNDMILLNFIDPVPPPDPFPVHHSSGGGRIIVPQPKLIFDIKKAFEFLLSQQKENGAFGEDLYTGWVTLALASSNYQASILKLTKYFEESKIESSILTDYERRTMALLALGLNPYNINGVNYIEKIITQFDGKQFGDANKDNDDIFALIVLQNVGYGQDEKIIKDDIAFILSRQKENGSWDESVDMTGGAIEALSVFNQNEQVKNALTKAKEFLGQNQKENGGWGNASSTAWALEGIIALGEKPEDWKKVDPTKNKVSNTPLDYLVTTQDTDGGIKNLPAQANENMQNKIWETAYVVSILSGKTWNQIMQKFEKPKIVPVAETPKNIIKKQKLKTIATAINAVTPSPAPVIIEKTEGSKKNWFVRFLDKIFSVF